MVHKQQQYLVILLCTLQEISSVIYHYSGRRYSNINTNNNHHNINMSQRFVSEAVNVSCRDQSGSEYGCWRHLSFYWFINFLEAAPATASASSGPHRLWASRRCSQRVTMQKGYLSSAPCSHTYRHTPRQANAHTHPHTHTA